MEKFCHLPTQATLGKPTFQFDAFLTILDKLFTLETKRGSALSVVGHQPRTGPTFLHINFLANPAWFTRLKDERSRVMLYA